MGDLRVNPLHADTLEQAVSIKACSSSGVAVASELNVRLDRFDARHLGDELRVLGHSCVDAWVAGGPAPIAPADDADLHSTPVDRRQRPAAISLAGVSDADGVTSTQHGLPVVVGPVPAACASDTGPVNDPRTSEVFGDHFPIGAGATKSEYL